ncbi:MAG: hypothetical protein IPG71_05270 [bacterium]|nr:hypothetical protein [bacterium]
MDDDALTRALIHALRERRDSFEAPDGRRYSRQDMQARLRELIAADLIVMRTCSLSAAIVVAAPHVSFDNWTQYYANRVAPALQAGEVLARNFRDEDGSKIPVSIGRHLHVNRPTESERRGGREFESDRARAVHADYIGALVQAGGKAPLDLLIELHGHHRHTVLEAATTGISEAEARVILDAYRAATGNQTGSPELHIEPLHELRYAARSAKELGSLRDSVCRRALHLELPRQCRDTAANREAFQPILTEWLRSCMTMFEMAA